MIQTIRRQAMKFTNLDIFVVSVSGTLIAFWSILSFYQRPSGRDFGIDVLALFGALVFPWYFFMKGRITALAGLLLIMFSSHAWHLYPDHRLALVLALFILLGVVIIIELLSQILPEPILSFVNGFFEQSTYFKRRRQAADEREAIELAMEQRFDAAYAAASDEIKAKIDRCNIFYLMIAIAVFVGIIVVFLGLALIVLGNPTNGIPTVVVGVAGMVALAIFSIRLDHYARGLIKSIQP